MIARWLARRRDRAALTWHNARRTGNPDSIRTARRRFDRWDALLDLWTAEGTH